MTDYCVSIDVHRTKSQVAVLDDEGRIEQEARVANTDFAEIAQRHAGKEALSKQKEIISLSSIYFKKY